MSYVTSKLLGNITLVRCVFVNDLGSARIGAAIVCSSTEQSSGANKLRLTATKLAGTHIPPKLSG